MDTPSLSSSLPSSLLLLHAAQTAWVNGNAPSTPTPPAYRSRAERVGVAGDTVGLAAAVPVDPVRVLRVAVLVVHRLCVVIIDIVYRRRRRDAGPSRDGIGPCRVFGSARVSSPGLAGTKSTTARPTRGTARTGPCAVAVPLVSPRRPSLLLLGSSLADVLFPSTDSVRRLAWLWSWPVSAVFRGPEERKMSSPSDARRETSAKRHPRIFCLALAPRKASPGL